MMLTGAYFMSSVFTLLLLFLTIVSGNVWAPWKYRFTVSPVHCQSLVPGNTIRTLRSWMILKWMSPYLFLVEIQSLQCAEATTDGIIACTRSSVLFEMGGLLQFIIYDKKNRLITQHMVTSLVDPSYLFKAI